MTAEKLAKIKELAEGEPSYTNAIKIEILAGDLLREQRESLEVSLESWKQIPTRYQGRLSYDYNERTGMFDITHGGYGIAQTEDSEVANAICEIINNLLYSGGKAGRS